MATNSPRFAGLRVAAFESRQAGEIARLIERAGGIPFVSPSMREVPLADQRSAIEFAHRLITGGIDVVIFMTGVGFRQLLAVVERHVDRQRFLDALADVATIARGPKPYAAMKEVGLTARHRVPEPNTWRELLTTIDRELTIRNQTVAIQEYGKTNPSLSAGLEARGAAVLPVAIYRWELPENPEPLWQNIDRIAAEEIDVVLFTSAQQVVNMLDQADQRGVGSQVRRALQRMAVVSVGPTTSEALRDHELPVDIEPAHPKMGSMVQAAAEQSAAVLARKRTPLSAQTMSELSLDTLVLPNWFHSPFMKACRGEPTKVTPIWLMRQAGRYMAEYRDVRSKVSFLELCKNPQLCAEVMATAVQRLGVDAAIIFSDLLPILEPMGLQLEFTKGDGPVIHNPVRSGRDVDRVRELETMQELSFVPETVRQTRAAIPDDIPVIGFSGAPFTLASYIIEGGSSRNYLHTKQLMYTDPGAWRTLMEKLARAVTRYLQAQIEAGAQAVQIFDSWIGCLGPDDYKRYVLPVMQQIFAGLDPDIPVIHFGAGNPALLPLLAQAGGRVIGIDWRVRLDDAWKTVGYDRSVQGNLDPTVLLSTPDEIRKRAAEVLAQAENRPGHIFNLGHGIHQQTPVDNVIALVDAVHELSSKRRTSP